MFLLRLHQAFRDHAVRYCVVGGHAVALHGAVRGTLDIDVVIPHERPQYIAAEKALHSLGLSSQLPVTAAHVYEDRDTLITQRHLIAWSFINLNTPTELIDILIAEDPSNFEPQTISIAGTPITVASIPDLIRMKTAAGRKQDVADIEALKKLAPRKPT